MNGMARAPFSEETWNSFLFEIDFSKHTTTKFKLWVLVEKQSIFTILSLASKIVRFYNWIHISNFNVEDLKKVAMKKFVILNNIFSKFEAILRIRISRYWIGKNVMLKILFYWFNSNQTFHKVHGLQNELNE